MDQSRFDQLAGAASALAKIADENDRRKRGKSEKAQDFPAGEDSAFEEWWKREYGDHMKGSKYLARKAWLAALWWKGGVVEIARRP